MRINACVIFVKKVIGVAFVDFQVKGFHFFRANYYWQPLAVGNMLILSRVDSSRFLVNILIRPFAMDELEFARYSVVFTHEN